MRSRGWFFWIVVVLAALFAITLLTGYAVLRGLRAVPSVAYGSTLTFDVQGELPEEDFSGLGEAFFGVERVTLRIVIEAIARAKGDPRIRSVVLHFRGADFGWAKAEEIRAAIAGFKTSGKKVVAYFEGGSNLDYFVATAADAVYLHPQGVLDVRGLAAEVTFWKGTLDKLGIVAEFEQIGRYKNAPDTLTRDGMSAPHREAVEAIVDDFHGLLIDSIATARKMEPEAVAALLSEGPFTAAKAKEAGLVDELLYEDEVEAKVTGEDEEFTPVTLANYHLARQDSFHFGSRPRVALIYGEGAIVSGESDDDPFFGRVMGADTIGEAFQDAREDDAVKAVVFRINSPGGSDIASDVIWREAALTLEEKPVIVSMSDVAASGGYWIATASEAIVAERTTLTGSIGIYGGKFSLEGLYRKIGARVETVERGESGDFWTSSRRFTEAERARLREILAAGYARFLEKVAESRDKDVDEVDALGEGRVWTGARALENGLVDELGGLERAVALAKEKADIPAERAIDLEVYPTKKGLWELLARRLTTSAPAESAATYLLNPKRLIARSPVLRLLVNEPRLALMPWRLSVR